MAVQSESFDVAVVGGGAIGLACAWRAQQRGARVIVIDAGEPGAWNVAAGMLAPVSEADFGERELLQLGLQSSLRYAAFCAELDDPGYGTFGTLAVARDRDEAAVLDRLLVLQRELGLQVDRLLPSKARALEPALAPTIRLALNVPGDHAIDPRKLVAALGRAFTGEQRTGRVTGLVTQADRVTGVALGDETIAAGQVVVAAGVDVARLDMPEHARVPVRPVKGQVLRLRDPNGPGLVSHTIRGDGVYFVPRGDGRYVLGATMEERGWNTTPTAGGVYELLRDISEIVPGVLELEIDQIIAGHYRNGILLTPITAELVVDALAGKTLPSHAAAADPRRFEGVLA